jgi:Protein of unknown function (DUF3048) N-terminal domain/Protein of unknown function (DUF3048) C-terminal domain
VSSSGSPRGSSGARRTAAAVLIAGAIGLVLVVGALVTGVIGSPHGSQAVAGSPGGTAAPTSGATSTPGPSTPGPTASPLPSPTPRPTSTLVPAPLTGLLVSPTAARRHTIAVMIDDHLGARPQSGFNAASIVWQAPAEGGIPRYMLVFQSTIPTAVGPVRSAREYFLEWAAEYRAMYLHAGGSPQALTTLRQTGPGTLVWNAEGLRFDGSFLFRVKFRFAPHNLYTDGTRLHALATFLHVPDGSIKPTWTFRPDSSDAERPRAGAITVSYPAYETIVYRYNPATNTYLRYINGSKKPQVDAADGKVVAPANVVILRMHFAPIAGPNPKHRLEATDVGSGPAWISTGGVTIQGTWRKASRGAPTLLFRSDGSRVVLTAGQTFVNVMPYGYPVTIADGKAPAMASGLPGIGFNPS